MNNTLTVVNASAWWITEAMPGTWSSGPRPLWMQVSAPTAIDAAQQLLRISRGSKPPQRLIVVAGALLPTIAPLRNFMAEYGAEKEVRVKEDGREVACFEWTGERYLQVTPLRVRKNEAAQSLEAFREVRIVTPEVAAAEPEPQPDDASEDAPAAQEVIER